MTHDQMIDVISAHKKGKTIQTFVSGNWVDSDIPTWNFYTYMYRVKPEPRELFALIDDSKDYVVAIAYSIDKLSTNLSNTRVIKVREVLDDE